MPTFLAALGSQYRLRLEVTENSIDIPGNYSVVSWALYIDKLSGSGRFTFSADSWSANIGGNGYGGSFTYDFRSYTTLLLGSATLNIGHNPDGTGTLSVSGTFNDIQANIGAGTASGSFALTTIPRASTPTFEIANVPQTTVDAGTALTLDMNRASSGFTHTLSYDFGPASNPSALTNQTSGLGATSGVGASTTFTPPLALLNSIPNNLSGVLTLRTKTYNGATLIGEKAVTITITVPTGASYEPDFGTITNSDTVTAAVTNIGAYVQAVSKLALAITSATAPYSATIASSQITVGGVVVLSAVGTTPANGTMPNPIIGSGTVAIVGRVTDSRGRTHSETVNVTVLPYTVPAISAVAFARSLAGGTLDEEGTYIRTDLTAAVQSLVVATVEKNAITIKISTRDHNIGGAWTLKTTLTPSAITYNSNAQVGTYSVGDSFDVLIEVTDKVGTYSALATGTITTAGVFMHWGGQGEGIGVGKYWEQGSVDALDQMYQNNGKRVLDEDDATTFTAANLIARVAARSRNCIIAGAFQVNQREYASGAALGSSGYGHDRMRGAGIVNRTRNPRYGPNGTTTTDYASALLGGAVWNGSGSASGGPAGGPADGPASYRRFTIAGTATNPTTVENARAIGRNNDVVAEDIYNRSVWVRVSVAWTGYVDSIFQNSGGSELYDVIDAGVAYPANTWVRLSSVNVAPRNSVSERGRVVFHTNLPNGTTVDVTGWQLTRGRTLWPYIDGTRGDCAWSGTADASTTVRGPATNSYTFTQEPQGQLVTLASGAGLMQVVERANVAAETYTLSWQGTAVGRIYNLGTLPSALPAFDVSGSDWVVDGLDDLVVEFRAVGGSRTLGFIQLERGTTATPFERLLLDEILAHCYRYFYTARGPAGDVTLLSVPGGTFSTAPNNAIGLWELPVEMRAPAVGSGPSTLSSYVVHVPGIVIAGATGLQMNTTPLHRRFIGFTFAAGLGSSSGQPFRVQTASGAGAILNAEAEF